MDLPNSVQLLKFYEPDLNVLLSYFSRGKALTQFSICLANDQLHLLVLFSWNNLAYCRRLPVTNVDHWISGFDKQTGKLLSAINRSFDIEEVREHTFITHHHLKSQLVLIRRKEAAAILQSIRSAQVGKKRKLYQ